MWWLVSNCFWLIDLFLFSMLVSMAYSSTLWVGFWARAEWRPNSWNRRLAARSWCAAAVPCETRKRYEKDGAPSPASLTPHSLTPFNQQYCSYRSAAPDRFQIGSWAALCHKRLIIGSLVWLLATRGSCLYSIKINWNPWTYYNIQRIQSILSFHQHQFPIIFNSICRNEWLNCCRQDFWFNPMKRSTICHSFNSHSNKNKLIRAIFERIESPRWRAVWFQAAGDRSGPIGMLTKLNAATVSLSLVYDSPLATNERTGGAEPR